MIPSSFKKLFLFLHKNMIGILLVTLIFMAVTVLIILNNITFPKKKKSKVERVIVIEKMTSKEKFNQTATDQLRSDKVCSQLDSKETCCSLGTCVWATATDKSNKINKCVAAATTVKPNSGETKVPGSLGPDAKCYKNPEGTFIGWEHYYYKEGDTIKQKASNFIEQCKKLNGGGF